MEAYFTSCNSGLVPISRPEVMPPLPSPSALCSGNPFQELLQILRENLSEQVKRAEVFSKLVFRISCLILSQWQLLSTLRHHCDIYMNTTWIHLKKHHVYVCMCKRARARVCILFHC